MCSSEQISSGVEGQTIERDGLPNAVAQAKGRRIRLCEMGHWCCSVIGTCLTHDDLLVIARKWNVHIESDARVFDVHGFFARKAGEPGDISRAIEKLLDSRYGGLIRRVSNTSDHDRLVDFWNTAVNDGFVAGAYWAIISHRHVPDELRNRTFGEVHMMSHLLGGTARKIVGAAAELQAKVDQMERRQVRWSSQVRHALDVRDGKIAKLQDELGRSRTKQRRRVLVVTAPETDKLSKLNAKQERALIAARTRARQLTNELERVKDRLSKLRKTRPSRASQSPVATFDLSLGLCGKAVLYLGGRQASVPQITKAAEAARVSLLHHDGGLEQSAHLIDDLINRCDAVICPIDCINHQACLKAKKLCKKMRKPFMPVSSRGTTTFQRALADLAARLNTDVTGAMSSRHGYFPVLAGMAAIGWLLLAQSPDLQADPSVFVPGEESPGGKATSRRSGKSANAFSHASGNISFEREFDFKIGNGIFRKLWVSAPASTNSSDGLGPLYNARACQRCHLKDGRGHPPENLSDNAVSMLLRVGIPSFDDSPPAKKDPVYGGQIQDFAIQGHKPEARIELEYEEFAVELSGGETVMLRRPKIKLADLAYGAMHPESRLSARVANQMIGLGLLEAISATDIVANADPEDADGDGISGRPNMVINLEAGMAEPGRFGWKASQPTVRQQSAAAFSGDMGLSTSLITPGAGDCTEPQAACLKANNGADPARGDVEVPEEMLDLVAFYARNLAVPKRSGAQSEQVLAGKTLFSSAGCAACHVPSFKTLDSRDVAPEQRGQAIWPYTDLLLHDMGDGLADGLPEGQALGREWRTAPLWGIGSTETVSGHTLFLHDGRARNLTEAILWHGGEAQVARDAFAAMTRKERADLIAFVNSL